MSSQRRVLLLVALLVISALIVPGARADLDGDGLEQIAALPSLASNAYYSVDTMVQDGTQYIAAANATQMHVWTEVGDVFSFYGAVNNTLSPGGGSIRFSPDGNKLVKCLSGGVEILVSFTPTSSLPGACNHGTISPDEKVAFSNNTSPYVFVYPLDFNETRRLYLTGGTAFASPPAVALAPVIFQPEPGVPEYYSFIATVIDGNVSVWRSITSGGIQTNYTWHSSYQISGTSTLEGSVAWNSNATMLLVTVPNNSGGSGCGGGKTIAAIAFNGTAAPGNALTCIGYPNAGGSTDNEGTPRFDPTSEYWGSAQSGGCTSTCGFRLWKYDWTGIRVMTVPANTTGGANAGNDIAWDPDGGYFYFASDTSPYLFAYKRSDGAVVRDWTSDSTAGAPTQYRASDDGHYFAASHATTPFVSIFNTSVFPRTQLANPATLPAGTGNGVAWGNGSQFLAVAHATTPFVTVYERSGDTFTKLTNPASLPASTGNAVAWSPNATHLAVGHATTPFVTVYERSGTTLTKFTNPASLPAAAGNAVAWSLNGTYLAVGGGGGLDFYFLSGSTLIKQTAPAVAPNGTVNALEWGPDGTLLVGHSSAPYVSLYTFVAGAWQKAPDVAGGLNALSRVEVAWNPEGNAFAAVAGGVPTLNVYSWDLASLTATRVTSYEIPSATSAAVEWYAGLTATESRLAVNGANTGGSIQWYNSTFGSPDAITLNVSAGNASAFLSWRTVEGALSYDVGYSTSSHSSAANLDDYTIVATVSSTTYLHTGLTNGAPAYYRVMANTGGLSNEATVTPWAAPSLIGSCFREEARLVWDAGGWSSPINFLLYRGNSSANLTLHDTLGASARGYEETLVAGDDYYYSVRVANATNTSAFSNVLRVTYCPPPPPVFGPDGSVWGGSQAEVANAFGISEDSIGILYGLLLVMITTALGFGAPAALTQSSTAGMLGALIGAVAGLILATVWEFFPLWVPFLVVVVLVAGVVLWARRGGDG